eukprot:1160066-Pelagomonas_calceolata.AAC.10
MTVRMGMLMMGGWVSYTSFFCYKGKFVLPSSDRLALDGSNRPALDGWCVFAIPADESLTQQIKSSPLPHSSSQQSCLDRSLISQQLSAVPHLAAAHSKLDSLSVVPP